MSSTNNDTDHEEKNGLRLLLIDDEPSILVAFEFAFGDAGWEVDTAESGEMAMKLFSPGAFDLVITDKNLPGMSGVEIVKKMRMLDSALTIMMLTGFGSASSAVDTLNAGVDAYIEKPVRDVMRLTSRAESILRRRQLQLEQEADASSVPMEAFHVLVLSADTAQAESIANDVAKVVEHVSIAPSLEAARERLSNTPHGLLLIEESTVQFTDAIDAIQREYECLPIAVIGQELGLEVIMRLVDLGVSACIVLPIGSTACSDRIAGLVRELRLS
ncbi:MAG: response regulator [Myxococcales bacterium]|nr:response regulator [Myxococcales bacterium]